MTEAKFLTIGRSRISDVKTLGLRPNTDTEADSTKSCDRLIFYLPVNSILASFKHNFIFASIFVTNKLQFLFYFENVRKNIVFS